MGVSEYFIPVDIFILKTLTKFRKPIMEVQPPPPFQEFKRLKKQKIEGWNLNLKKKKNFYPTREYPICFV